MGGCILVVFPMTTDSSFLHQLIKLGRFGTPSQDLFSTLVLMKSLMKTMRFLVVFPMMTDSSSLRQKIAL